MSTSNRSSLLLRRCNQFQASMRRRHRDDHGLTLVELLVAFAALLVLMTIAGTAITTYLSAGNTVISSYSATDELLPSSIVIQRLIRSEVEPAPTPATGVPVPAFLPGSLGTYSTTFYANVGSSQRTGQDRHVRGHPHQVLDVQVLHVDLHGHQYSAVSGCPFSVTSASTCTWSTNGIELVSIPNVVNGANRALTTPLPDSGKPIFTYNTLDPYSTAYVPGDGGTPSATTGILPTFSTCAAPSPAPPATPTSANCDADNVQSVGVDLEVQVQGSPIQENSFTVYRLSSASYLYSPLVG